ncbi:MAG: CAP domain-containing protein [Sphingomonas fennica]
MRTGKRLAFAALMAGAAAAAPAARIDPATIVGLHNVERAAVGAPPIAWDPALAASAAGWARVQARAGRIWHDPDNRTSGENIWMGTRGAYTLTEMIGGWSEEKAALPSMDRWLEVHPAASHYTQMIWAKTTRVGCALAADRASEFLVCRYGPPGNTVGRHPLDR